MRDDRFASVGQAELGYSSVVIIVPSSSLVSAVTTFFGLPYVGLCFERLIRSSSVGYDGTKTSALAVSSIIGRRCLADHLSRHIAPVHTHTRSARWIDSRQRPQRANEPCRTLMNADLSETQGGPAARKDLTGNPKTVLRTPLTACLSS